MAEIWIILSAIGTLILIVIAVVELNKVNRNVKRSYSPILLIDLKPPINFSRTFEHYPVVQSVSFDLHNDGNGPALNINIKVQQGKLELERSVNPSWSHRRISLSELHRNSLAKGETLEYFFRVKAGFTPPKEGEPFSIEVNCKNIYNQKGTFRFEAPTDILSALGERSQTLIFNEMKGF